MDGGIGIASGIAGLIAVSAQVTQLIYSYIQDIRHASRTQKAYLSEVSALTDILLRFEDVLQNAGDYSHVSAARPDADVVQQCRKQLDNHRIKLQKHINKFIWPFEAKELKKAIEDLHRFRSIFGDYVATSTSSLASATLSSVDLVKRKQDRASLLGVLQNGDTVFKARPEPLAGTGKWLLQHQEYKAWTASSPSILWCYGAPGVGKSLLASLVITDLSREQQRDQGHVLYHFCSFASRKQENETAILRDLLRQLAEQSDHDITGLLFTKRHSITSTSSPREIAEVFSQLPLKTPMYIVIDALDELENVRQVALRLLSLTKIGFKVLVTSRDVPDVRNTLSQSSSIAISARPEDIKAYVCDRFQESDFYDVVNESHNLVVDIVKRADGLFILAKLLMDRMLACLTIKQMRKTLNSSPSTLSEAYSSSLERIEALESPSKDLALRLISWIVYAERALHPQEVIHAFALESDEDEIDEESLTRPSTLLRICAGLVILDSEVDALELVHTTAYEYFAANENSLQQAHTDIASTSLRYLCLKALRLDAYADVGEIEWKLKHLPFLRYASRYWGKHVLNSNAEDQLGAQIQNALRDSFIRMNAFFALCYQGTIQNQELAIAVFASIPRGQNELHTVAYWGLTQTARQLIDEGIDPNTRNSQGWCPLHWAAHNGHITMMQLLLDSGVDPNAQDERGWTALFWSSFYGYKPDIQLLLNKGADHTVKDANGWTALHWAVSRGKADSVQLLLHQHAQKYPNEALSRAQNDRGESMDLLASEKLLEIAANENDINVFEMLLNAHFDAKDPDFEALWSSGRFDPPLGNMWRTLNKAEHINGVESYLSRARYSKKGTSKEADNWKGRLVHSAIKDDQLSGLRLMLELGADPNYTIARSPLHAAALRQNPEFTRLLLQYGADASIEDHYGQSPLHQAIICGFAQTVQALVEGRCDVNACVSASRKAGFDGRRGEGDHGKTPLMLACELPADTELQAQSRDMIVTCLLSSGVDIRLVDSFNRSSLHYAIDSGSADIVEKVLRLGCNADVIDKNGVSTMHLAAQSCDLKIFKLLTNYGANGFTVDNFGRSCFHFLVDGYDEPHCIEDLNELFSLLKAASDLAHLNAEVDITKPRGYRSSVDLLHQHTPLSLAIEKKNWKLFQVLAEAGAELPAETGILLRSAVESLHPPAVHFLLDHGAKLNGRRPTFSALEEEPACWLREAMSNETINLQYLDTIIQELCDSGDVDLDKPDYLGETLLHKAAYKCDSGELSKMLLKHGCNPFIKDKRGIDVFLKATLQNSLSVLQVLLLGAPIPYPEGHWIRHVKNATGAPKNVLLRICEAFKTNGQLDEALSGSCRLLDLAISAGNAQLARVLVDLGADTAITDEFGWTALHHAVHQGRKEIVNHLLQNKSSVHTKTARWSTEWSRPSMLYQGDPWTGTPLHLAVLTVQEDIVLELLHLGADVNAKTGEPKSQGGTIWDHAPSHGPTALRMALHKDKTYGLANGGLSKEILSIARVLLDHGADANGVGELLQPCDRQMFRLFDDVWTKLKGTDSDAPK